MLYMANHIAYKPGHELKTCKTNELELTFIELINSKKQNILIGCIYRLLSMKQEEFNKYYLKNLLEKLAVEKKIVFLHGDFIISLLEYEKYNPTNESLNYLSSNMFLQYVLLSS